MEYKDGKKIDRLIFMPKKLVPEMLQEHLGSGDNHLKFNKALEKSKQYLIR